MKEGLKPSLATTRAKASERVVADPPGWERGRGRRGTICFPRCGKSEATPCLATTCAKASERVIADPPAGNAGEGDEVRSVFRAAEKAKLSRVCKENHQPTQKNRTLKLW